MTGKTGRMRYVSNAGLVLEAEGESIGIDLFSRDSSGLYPDTPPQVKAELFAGIEKGGIVTLLFTHAHGDHFCLEDTAEALGRNPELMVISTEEVIGKLCGLAPDGGRMYEVSPEEKGNVKIWFPGGCAELFNSTHMGEVYAGVQNLTAMVEMEGKRMVFLGDAWPREELFARIGAWEQTPDVLIAPFPVIGLPSSRRLLVKHLKPAQILALHLPKPERDSQNWLASAKKVCESAKDGLHMPWFGE